MSPSSPTSPNRPPLASRPSSSPPRGLNNDDFCQRVALIGDIWASMQAIVAKVHSLQVNMVFENREFEQKTNNRIDLLEKDNNILRRQMNKMQLEINCLKSKEIKRLAEDQDRP